jgi:hypothetical protein
MVNTIHIIDLSPHNRFFVRTILCHLLLKVVLTRALDLCRVSVYMSSLGDFKVYNPRVYINVFDSNQGPLFGVYAVNLSLGSSLLICFPCTPCCLWIYARGNVCLERGTENLLRVTSITKRSTLEISSENIPSLLLLGDFFQYF